MTFDFRNPDYVPIFRQRLETLQKLRADAGLLAAFRVHYANNPADFINDWGVTYDPRNINRGLPAIVPFVLFPKQREWIEYTMRKWGAREDALTEKSRDAGVSWLAISLGATLCIFRPAMTIGYGSRKEEYVDKLDDPKSLFFKARMFIRHLPREFRAGWEERKHAPHMRIVFPETGSSMTGEAGDGIGRGDRKSLYFVDEAAHLERPQLVDASLSATTDARHDISSVRGRDNPFAEKRFGGFIEPFIFDWRDDPRKDDAWYADQCRRLSAVVVAQEIDRNYDASKEGIVIPNAWIQSAIDAHVKLGVQPSGARTTALDVADEGKDLCAQATRYGVILRDLDEWTGKGDDIFGTTQKAFTRADMFGADVLLYDADGLGAGVRGDARVINEQRKASGLPEVDVQPFRGSGEVVDPDGPIPSAVPVRKDDRARTNKDFFANRKAQGWWALRVRFEVTHRAVTEGAPFDPDDIISLPSDLPHLAKLTTELSQPTWSPNNAGKIVIDKAPEGAKSPNLADAVMIGFSPQQRRKRGFLA